MRIRKIDKDYLDLKWLKLHSSGKHSLGMSFYNAAVLMAVAK